MTKISLLAGALALASPFALASDTLPIESVMGAYKVQIGEVFGGTPPMGEDILEIVRINPRAAYIRVHLESLNTHLCNANGIAKANRNALIYKAETTDGRCVLSISLEGQSIVLHDRALVCQQTLCGANFGFDGVSFPRSKRHAIRYMKRLLRSEEYAEAMREWRSNQ